MSMTMLYEHPEDSNELTSGIQIIQSAFINQSNYYQNEILNLTQENHIKSSRINELEQQNSLLYTEKEEYESTIQKLLAENSRLSQLLENARETERHQYHPQSIEKDYQNQQGTLEHDESNFSTLLETTKKTLRKNKSTIPVSRLKNPSENIDNIISGFDETISRIKKYNNNTKQLALPTEYDFRQRHSNKDYKEVIKTQVHDMRKEERKQTYNMYSNKNDFFKQCRGVMSHKDYSRMIEVVKLANAYQITKNETYNRISYMMEKKYPQLMDDLEEFLYPKNIQE